MTVQAIFAAPRISVVVPTRNEVDNLEQLHSEISAALDGISHEVVVVDDSNDELTRPALRELCRRDPRWRTVEREPREQTGLSTAVLVGMRMARGDAVCVMDGDLQHPPALIPELLAAIDRGADVAVASRYSSGGSREGLSGLARRLVSSSATDMARLVFREARRSTDPMSGFFCCRRRAVAGIEMRPVGFKVLLELLVCLPELRVVDVPFSFRERYAGDSKASVRQGMLYLRHLASLLRYVPHGARLLKATLGSEVALLGYLAVVSALLAGGMTPFLAVITGTGLTALGSMVLRRSADIPHPLEWAMSEDGVVLGWALAVQTVATLAADAWLSNRSWHVVTAALVGRIIATPLTAVVAILTLRTRTLVKGVDDLSSLQRRLNAIWADYVWPDADAADLVVEGHALPHDLVERAARQNRPILWVESPSSRPQPRRNVERMSALLVPRSSGDEGTEHVAVLMRHSTTPFDARDLDTAIAWMASSTPHVTDPGRSPELATVDGIAS